MDIEISTDELKHTKLFVGCPVYDGRCHSEFTFALCQLTAICAQAGIALQLCFVAGDALVMKARNAIADQFLHSDATHLMFIDADIAFNPMDVLTLLGLQARDLGRNPYDVLTAPYPLKRVAWDKVAQAVKQGLAEPDAAALNLYAADIQIYALRGGEYDVGAPVEVAQAATGFMMIRRETLERFQAHYPTKRYRPDAIGADSGASPTIAQFFDTALDGRAETLEEDLRAFLAGQPQAGRDDVLDFLSRRGEGFQEMVSEDFMFCRLVRRAGLRVWTCPWMALSHIGKHVFASRLVDLARLGPV